MKKAAARKDNLTNSASHNFLNEDVSKVQLSFDIEIPCFAMAVSLLSDLTARNRSFLSVQKVVKFASTHNLQAWSFFKESKNFIGLCLCFPMSAPFSERSLSALLRLKTLLRNVKQ